MKKHLFALSAVALCATAAHAQSTVTIYGIIDAGINYASSADANHHSLVSMDSGVAQGSRIGFKGNEDLGGGNSAFFVLENGFNVDTGTAGQGGALFGRQALVGLQNKDIGSVSLGRQYDFMANMAFYATGGMTVAGSLGWGLHMNAAAKASTGGPLDDRVSGNRTNNAVKFESATFSGFKVGAMYGFGENAGSTADGSTLSLMGSYKNGPFSSTLAYTDIKKNTVALTPAERIYGLGLSYAFDSFTPFILFTQAKNPDGTGTVTNKVSTVDVGATYNLTPALVLGGGYQYQKRADLNGSKVGNAQQVNASLDYFFSKRTDVYTAVAYGKDDAYGAGYSAAVMSGGGVNSFKDNQTIFRVGIRHKF